LINLNDSEHQVYSQNGEDGIINAILGKIGSRNNYYVEIGGGKPYDNTRWLRQEFGYTGLLINSALENPKTNLKKEFVNQENVNKLFTKYDVPLFFDILSIDIDSNDWYVWKAIDEIYQPSIVCIEYNAKFLPGEGILYAWPEQRIFPRLRRQTRSQPFFCKKRIYPRGFI
jgi:hypothetical protein